jgi:predicted flap endonuclease-1-like 5' DNA nuclease
MHWLSFFIGLLVGWVIEWLLDVLFWRRRSRGADDAEARIRALEDEVARRKVRAAELNDCEARVQAQAQEVQRLSAQLDAARAEAEGLREQLAAARAGAVGGASLAAAAVELDDLRKIEGIGPKIARILQDHGVQTFAQLAQVQVDRLREILQEAGPRFRIADPTSWPEQARLAAQGDWDALGRLQDELVGGRRRPS